MELVVLRGPAMLGFECESCEIMAFRSPAGRKNYDGGRLSMALARCFQNLVLVSSACLLCGAQAATMWRGDSVVLDVAVRILPEIGFIDIMVGVILGDVMRVTPV